MSEVISPRKNREVIISYIEACLTKGYTKKAAYIQFVNPDASPKSVHSLIRSFEKGKDFQEIQKVLMEDDNLQLAVRMADVRRKFVGMVDRTIDTMGEIFDEAKDSKEKAKAVRLANETVTALAVVSGNGGDTANKGGKPPVDPSSIVQ